jgi:hypothetical protein
MMIVVMVAMCLTMNGKRKESKLILMLKRHQLKYFMAQSFPFFLFLVLLKRERLFVFLLSSSSTGSFSFNKGNL